MRATKLSTFDIKVHHPGTKGFHLVTKTFRLGFNKTFHL